LDWSPREAVGIGRMLRLRSDPAPVGERRDRILPGNRRRGMNFIGIVIGLSIAILCGTAFTRATLEGEPPSCRRRPRGRSSISSRTWPPAAAITREPDMDR